jgi:predicted RNase H-like nuclease (RuvC/YqgF family)
MNDNILRFKQLQNITYKNDEEEKEFAKLKEEMELTKNDLSITPLENQLQDLKEEKKQIELRVKVQREKDKIAELKIKEENDRLKVSLKKKKDRDLNEKLKNQLDGKMYCKEHHGWFYPNHFRS